MIHQNHTKNQKDLKFLVKFVIFLKMYSQSNFSSMDTNTLDQGPSLWRSVVFKSEWLLGGW